MDVERNKNIIEVLICYRYDINLKNNNIVNILGLLTYRLVSGDVVEWLKINFIKWAGIRL